MPDWFAVRGDLVALAALAAVEDEAEQEQLLRASGVAEDLEAVSSAVVVGACAALVSDLLEMVADASGRSREQVCASLLARPIREET